MNVTIEVFADVVCPWCYIGEKRLERVLDNRQDLQVTWRWRPYQLQPQMPKSGLDWDTFAQQKFGSIQRARAAFRQVEMAGAPEGLTFDFDHIASAPNTVDAHRLILLAQQDGRSREAASTLFRAYFAEGADLNDLDTLARLGERMGLEAETVLDFLRSDRLSEIVSRDQEIAERAGIGGVPFFIFDGKYVLSGAQPSAVFERIVSKFPETNGQSKQKM